MSTKQWIVTLRLQYSELENRGGLDLLLATRRFIQFLESDPQSCRYIKEMERNWEKRYKGWFDECREIQNELSKLENKIKIAGSNIRTFLDGGNDITDQAGYGATIHILEKIEEPDWYTPWNNLTDNLNIDTLHYEKPHQTQTGHMEAHVLGVTQALVRLTKAIGTDLQLAEELCREAEVLRRKYNSTQWKIKNDWISSGFCAFNQLKIVVKIIDREVFIDPSSINHLGIRRLLPWTLLLVMCAPPDLQDAAKYWLKEPNANKDCEKEIEPLIKQYLQHVFAELLFIANTRLSHQYLIRQYKARCENYEWKDIADTIERYTQKVDQMSEEKGKHARYGYEDILTLHLARYLHDNGHSVHYTPRDGVHEPDLLGKMSNELEPIVVEAKVVGQKQGKEQGAPWIYNGLRALLAYLEKYHNDYGVTDGYLIVFRIGDETTPNYTFDRSEWEIGQYTIMPVIVNIGQINKKDSPVIITKDEFLRQYNNITAS